MSVKIVLNLSSEIKKMHNLSINYSPQYKDCNDSAVVSLSDKVIHMILDPKYI